MCIALIALRKLTVINYTRYKTHPGTQGSRLVMKLRM